MSDWSSDLCSSDLPRRWSIRPPSPPLVRTGRLAAILRMAFSMTPVNDVRRTCPERRHRLGRAAGACYIAATRSSPTEALAMTVVTRFPPSPTGFLHIGGARPALFNWLRSEEHTYELQSLMRIST